LALCHSVTIPKELSALLPIAHPTEDKVHGVACIITAGIAVVIRENLTEGERAMAKAKDDDAPATMERTDTSIE